MHYINTVYNFCEQTNGWKHTNRQTEQTNGWMDGNKQMDGLNKRTEQTNGRMDRNKEIDGRNKRTGNNKWTEQTKTESWSICCLLESLIFVVNILVKVCLR